MSFPFQNPIGTPDWEGMLTRLSQVSRGGGGVAQSLGQDLLNEATRGFRPGTAQPNVQDVAAQLQQQGLVDPNNPNPPAGIDKALAGRGNVFQKVGQTLQNRQPNIQSPATMHRAGQGRVPGMVGAGMELTQPSQFTGGTFANMAQQAAQQQAEGQELPFQDMKQDEIIPSFNRDSPDGQRVTSWDTDDVYQVVNQLSNEDYAELESIETKEELVDISSDTTINALEEAGIYMSPELEERFKAGIGPAMDDWYQQQTAKRGLTDMTSYMMGMTQFALALVETYQEEPSVAQGTTPANYGSTTPQTSTGSVPQSSAPTFSGEGGMPTEEEFLEAARSGQIPPEIIQGYVNYIENNPQGTYEEFISRGGQ